MRLTDASVTIRPRNPWEAIDLGVLLARKHRRLLMTSWAIATLPIYALLSFLLWDYPSLVIFLFWWLKPLYERLALSILAQSLFGDPPTLRQSLIQWLGLLKPQLIASLTWRRFGLSRSFLLPVQQLEGLTGTARAQRIGVLSHTGMRAARLLTILGSALEMGMWVGLIVLFYAFIPQQVEIDWSWHSLLNIEGEWNWFEHLTNAFYALVLIVWGPVYVACGFTLYLNRRTELEAWDIELVFRRLRQRMIGSAYALLLGIGIALSMQPISAMADQDTDPTRYSCPLPPLDQPQVDDTVAAPGSPRLLNQAVTSQASETAIKSILDSPPFKNPKTVSGWRISEQADAKTSGHKDAPAWLAHLISSLMGVAAQLANLMEIFLWTATTMLLAWIAWKYRSWISTFVSRSPRKTAPRRTTPQQLFGLQIGIESLPADVAGTVEKLWPEHPREALSLLYRALLSRLLTDYSLPLKSSDTEGQVLEQVAALDQPPLHAFSQELTGHWQKLAYGHHLPPAGAQQQLCDGWRRLFAVQVSS
jgi:hypothetical protein